MPQPKVALDYGRCDPEFCEDGVCAAAKVCEKKVLRQEQPGDMPDIFPALCRGCIDCISACPRDAIRLMK